MKHSGNKSFKAFTLIELLVVVAIIGILTAVGVVAYGKYTDGAKNAIIKSNHQKIKELIKAEIADCHLSGGRDYKVIRYERSGGKHLEKESLDVVQRLVMNFKCTFWL